MEMENGKRIDAKLRVMHAIKKVLFTTERRELFLLNMQNCVLCMS